MIFIYIKPLKFMIAICLLCITIFNTTIIKTGVLAYDTSTFKSNTTVQFLKDMYFVSIVQIPTLCIGSMYAHIGLSAGT